MGAQACWHSFGLIRFSSQLVRAEATSAMGDDMYSSGGLDHSAVKSLYATNKWKSLSTLDRVKYVQYRDMQIAPRRKGDPDYRWPSKATTCFRHGMTDAAGISYTRDINTGTWYRDVPEKRRDFHYTGSSLNMKFTEMAQEKPQAGGSFRRTMSLYSAPVPGGFWVEKNRDAPKSMIIASTGDLSHNAASYQHPLVKSTSLPQLKKGTYNLRKSPIDKAF